MKIIDTHTHIFPTKIAAKASANIGRFYDMGMRYDGTIEQLLKICDENSIDKCLVNSVATTAEQVHSINTFISDSVRDSEGRFFGFGSLHPDQSNADLESELDYMQECGLVGVKLHPDFQEFAIDRPDVYRVYERLEGRFPLLIHTGDSRYSWSNPHRLRTVKKDFPKLVVIAAHFGGWSEWADGVKQLMDVENVYVDTCSSFYALSPQTAHEYIKAFTVERVLFGTDYPMWSAKDELEHFHKIPLNETEREKILYKNAAGLFDIV